MSLPFDQLATKIQIERYTQLAKVALKHYPLTINTLTHLTQRYNVIFRVEAVEGTFALRISGTNHRTALQVHSEMQWVDTICKETDIQVACPLRTHNNHLMLYLSHEYFPEGRSIVVINWLDGEPVRKQATVETIRQLGQVIARINQHSLSYHPNGDFMTFDDFSISEYGDLDYIYQPHDLLTPEQQTLFQEGIVRIQNLFTRWREEAPRLYLVHHDIQLSNSLIHKGKIALIDFDDCRWGLLVQDILPAWYLVMNDQSLSEALLDGYTDVRSLPCTLAELKIAVTHRALWGLTYMMHYRRQSLCDEKMLTYIRQAEETVLASI